MKSFASLLSKIAPPSVFLALGVMFTSVEAHAALTAYEGFDVPGTYTNGSLIQDVTGGGTGWSATSWTDGVNVTDEFTATSTGLSYTNGANTLSTTAGAAQEMGTTASNSPAIRRQFVSSASWSDGSSVWVSYLMNKTAGSSSQTKFEFLNATSSANMVSVANSSATAGQGWTLGNTSTTASGGTLSLSTTYMVLLKVDFASGTNDTVKLWINPDLSSAPTDGTEIASITALGDLNTTLSAVRFSSGASATVTFDELRIGTSFADVAPIAVPEPSTNLLIGVSMLLAQGIVRRRLKRH